MAQVRKQSQRDRITLRKRNTEEEAVSRYLGHGGEGEEGHV